MKSTFWHLAVLAGGCAARQKTAANHGAAASVATASVPVEPTAATVGQNAAPAGESKTVEFVETSKNDLPAHMSQWAQEGWRVLSISKRLEQPDGTVIRRVELFRPRETANPPSER